MYYNSYMPNKCPMGTMPYMVKAGDTFYNIAIRCNTTVAALMAANPNVNPNSLYIGQIICVPMSQPQPQPPCPGGTYYTVKAGDTFFSIARRYNISVDALIAANPNVNPDALYVGQVICIPKTTPPPQTCPVGTTPYIVRPGDTFFSIARRYNISVDALIAANPNVNPDNLQVGQQICIPMGTPPQKCPIGTTPYTVKAGDTIFSIAQKHNTTVDAILRANPGLNPNNLQIGQIICIPMGTPPQQCPAGTTPYTIRSGDTFYLLAQRYNTTVEAIQRANPGVDPNNLQIGQVICMPGTPPTTPPPSGCPTGTTPYTIKSGDTLYLLAKKFNTTVEAIEKANPGINPNNLQIGQVICIPKA